MEQNAKSPKTGLKKLGSNLLIFSVGSFAAKLMGYVLLPFYTHVLSQEEYGVFDLVTTTANLLFPLFTLLITEATMRFALDHTNDHRKVFTLSLLTVCAGLAAAAALSPLLLLTVYRPYVPYFILYYVLNALHTLFAQYAKGREKTKAFAASGIIGAAVTVLLNVLLLAVWKWGLTGYFIAAFAGFGCSSLYLFLRCGMARDICRLTRADLPLWREMLRFSLPIMPNSVSWWISTSSDKYIINFVCGVAATGLYAAAYKIPSLFTVFTAVFLGAWQISAVENFGTESSRALYARVWRLFFACLAVAGGAMIALVKPVTVVLFDAKFYEAWAFVPLLVFATLFHDMAAFLGSVYLAAKRTKMLFWSTLAGALLNIALNLWLIPEWGALGAAFTTFISYFAVWLIRFFDTKKLLRLPYRYATGSLTLAALCGEVAVTTLDIPYAMPVALGLFAAVLFLQAKPFLEAIRAAWTALKKRKEVHS